MNVVESQCVRAFNAIALPNGVFRLAGKGDRHRRWPFDALALQYRCLFFAWIRKPKWL